jgi:uncharacterized protein YbgA (DUF1722 family)/uncharacterized protein YbbK (DUF523 family)
VIFAREALGHASRTPPWKRGIDGPLRIGVSSCLLGLEVRYDGGHKHDGFLTGLLGPHVEWVPVCPEVEMGLGIPRPPIRLQRSGGAIALVDPKSGADHTEPMRSYAARRVAELARQGLAGYVLKKDSPSCGLERVRVWSARSGRPPARDGRGLFAAALCEALPLLPVEEEGRLHDPRLRENFVERIFAAQRLRALFGGRWSAGDLVEFHTAHKLTLLAHAPLAYRALGRLVAEAGKLGRKELRTRYERELMQALSHPASTARHTNALQHAAGYFKRDLDAGARAELAELIDEYRAGRVPLVVPITLIRHHVRALGVEYLAEQVYLDPHPRELMLRNHV